MSDEFTIIGNPGGSLVRHHPDGTTEPYIMPEPDWEALDAMTDEELTAAALFDPDNPPLTDEQLERGCGGLPKWWKP